MGEKGQTPTAGLGANATPASASGNAQAGQTEHGVLLGEPQLSANPLNSVSSSFLGSSSGEKGQAPSGAAQGRSADSTAAGAMLGAPGIGGNVSSLDPEQLIQLVMEESAADTENDLRNQLSGMDAELKQKQAARALDTGVDQGTAPSGEKGQAYGAGTLHGASLVAGQSSGTTSSGDTGGVSSGGVGIGESSGS